jgi:P27 family predicted phage terminase small subunit
MGRRGPPPQPTAMKLIRGNPGKRKLNKNEPQPAVAMPHCPDYLDVTARNEWDRLAPILVRMRVLTEADYLALAGLCQTYSTMVKAQEQLNKSGILFKTPSGYVQQFPLIGVVNNCMEKIITFCREFGLTPSARTRIQTTTSELQRTANDPWDKFD